MLYSFKQKSQDFIVEEILPFALDGKGDAFFVYFEKRNLNTMDVVKHLCKELWISRLTLGIAGLKDKDAITRQRISIYKSALKKLGGEREFLRALEEVARIIKTDRHKAPIGMTTRIENMFHIRLRANQDIALKTRQDIENKITQFLKSGFPNFFGEQRFGINKQNIEMGRQIIDGKLRIKEKFEAKFKLQAYASHLFNEYLKMRIKEGNITPDETGPVFGDDMKHTEIPFMKKYQIDKQFFATYKRWGIFGLRRKLWVYPKDIQFRRQGDDILLDFALPGGTYASILVEEILKVVR